MAYVGVLLITILVSLIVVRIGAFVLHLTGIEPDVARFQALSAFSGTGFTTREAERVMGHRTRRRIVTVLIILGNAGLVTIIAALVASFTQVSSYEWVFVRLAIIVGGILGFYRLIMKSRVGHRIVDRLRKPLPNRILREAPLLEDIFSGGKDWAVSPVTIKQRLRSVGLSVAEISAEGNIEILSIDRAGAYLARPGGEEKIEKGDRLLVYVNRNSLPRLVG